MRKLLDGWDIAANVRFTRQVHKGGVLILEGGTDDKALSKFMNPQECIVEISFGKTNAISALDILEDEGFPGIIGLVDADFDRIIGNEYSLENLAITDHHDLDITILVSPALGIIIKEYGDMDKFNRFCGGSIEKLINIILESAEPLSYCRLLSESRNLKLNFKDLRYSFINVSDLRCDVDALVDEVVGNSPAARCDRQSLRKWIEKAAEIGHDRREITCGHDATAILGIALRSFIGNRRVVHTWAREIESNLRLAFDIKSFRLTKVFAQLIAWQDANSPYRILA